MGRGENSLEINFHQHRLVPRREGPKILLSFADQFPGKSPSVSSANQPTLGFWKSSKKIYLFKAEEQPPRGWVVGEPQPTICGQEGVLGRGGKVQNSCIFLPHWCAQVFRDERLVLALGCWGFATVRDKNILNENFNPPAAVPDVN